MRCLFGMCFLFLILTGCQKYYLVVKKERVSLNDLASTFVGSPDPRQKENLHGERLIIEWRLPSSLIQEDLEVVLHLIYHDITEQTISYQIEKKTGVIIYSLLNQEYDLKKGLLSYQAEIRNWEGKILKVWQEQLFVRLVQVDDF